MTHHWKTLLAAVVFAGATSSAAIADGYEPTGKGFAPPPKPSWTGFYAGVEVGGRWLDAEWTTTQGFFPNVDPTKIPFSSSPSQSFNGGDLRGGVYVGWNQQISPNWVAGVEANLGYADQDERSNRLPGLQPGGINRTSVEATWDGSVRGRLGALVNPSTLVYGTAGVAFQEIETRAGCVTVAAPATDLNCNPGLPLGTVFSNSASETLVGWTVGGGIEKLMHKSWLLRLDYRYADFEDFSFIALRANPDLFGANAKLDTQTHTVSVGIAKKF